MKTDLTYLKKLTNYLKMFEIRLLLVLILKIKSEQRSDSMYRHTLNIFLIKETFRILAVNWRTGDSNVNSFNYNDEWENVNEN